MNDKVYTIGEVAEYYKLNPTTVWRWIRKGKLPAIRVGKCYRIKESDLEALERGA